MSQGWYLSVEFLWVQSIIIPINSRQSITSISRTEAETVFTYRISSKICKRTDEKIKHLYVSNLDLRFNENQNTFTILRKSDQIKKLIFQDRKVLQKESDQLNVKGLFQCSFFQLPISTQKIFICQIMKFALYCGSFFQKKNQNSPFYILGI